MLSAIDTNVISALWSEEPTAGAMAELLRTARSQGALTVSAPVYAELHAYPGATAVFVEKFISDTGIRVDFDLGDGVWRLAASTFAEYAERRRRSGGGGSKRLLVDFIVGAHAATEADRLLTLDPDRYRTAFPDLRLEGL